MRTRQSLRSAYRLYYDGFTHMQLGRTLWLVVIVKLVIMFGIVRLLFMPNFLNSHAPKGGEADYVATQVIDRQ